MAHIFLYSCLRYFMYFNGENDFKNRQMKQLKNKYPTKCLEREFVNYKKNKLYFNFLKNVCYCSILSKTSNHVLFYIFIVEKNNNDF